MTPTLFHLGSGHYKVTIPNASPLWIYPTPDDGYTVIDVKGEEVRTRIDPEKWFYDEFLSQFQDAASMTREA